MTMTQPDLDAAAGGLGFELDEELAMVRDTARDFADVVLAPLVGCDRRGGRLGQGKGFYDRALAQLDAAGGVFVVGVACDCQVAPAVPTEAHDRRLDAVLTEREWIALSE